MEERETNRRCFLASRIFSFHEPVRSAVVPTAGSDSVPLSEATSPAGRRGEPAGAGACATTMRFKVRGRFQKERETAGEPGRQALSQLKILRPDFLPVAVQDGNAPFRSPLRLARVAGIEIQHAADGFAEALVRMAEDHHVRPFAGGAGLQFFIQILRLDDVLDEKFPAGEFNSLD